MNLSFWEIVMDMEVRILTLLKSEEILRIEDIAELRKDWMKILKK